MEERFYTIAQAATLLDCSEQVLGIKLRNKEMKGFKQLGKWFVLHSDLVEFIKEGKANK